MSELPSDLPGGSQDKVPGLYVGNPTVAPNAGASVPDSLLRKFNPSNLPVAEWCRLPAPRARCRLTGLSRTTLNELIERKEIRAITIHKPGSTRGIKLLDVQSLRRFLARLDVEQNGPSRSGTAKPA